MLVGGHQNVAPYPELIDDIVQDRFFGVVACDIKVPENLKEKFSEFQPIFKNVEIEYKDLSDETKTQVKESYKSRKLIGRNAISYRFNQVIPNEWFDRW